MEQWLPYVFTYCQAAFTSIYVLATIMVAASGMAAQIGNGLSLSWQKQDSTGK